MHVMNRNYIAILLFLLVTSCAGIKNISSIPGVEESSCNNQSNYHYTDKDLPQPIHELKIDTLLTNHFSFQSLNVANAIGLLDLLQEYQTLKNKYNSRPTLEGRLELLETAQYIYQKINLSSLEVSSVASELDCEEKRADQIAHYLQSRQETRQKNLIISSIIVGAVGSITSVILSNTPSAGNSSSYVSVGTSITEATLGVLMLLNKKKIYFHHQRNTPAEIWNGALASATLPPSIWYYLNYKKPEKDFKSLRDVIVENWQSFGQVAAHKNNKSKSFHLYFGTGGEYNAVQLKTRADMYDQIGSYITLMKQDLRKLTSEFEAIVRKRK